MEVVSDVISGVVVLPTGVKVLVNFFDSRSNRSHFVTNYDDNDAGRQTI